MEELLSLARDVPRRSVEAGEVLLTDGAVVHALYVLLEGALKIEKNGVPIATVTEPGACVGEMSLLLGVAATADVVASERSQLAVIENAEDPFSSDPTWGPTCRRRPAPTGRCTGSRYDDALPGT
jgi:CRP-like cAMP-binding protein